MRVLFHRIWRVTPFFVAASASILLAYFALSTSVNGATTTPTTMNLQGRLLDSAGAPVADGLYNMQFRLFTVSSGGSSVWNETRETSTRVQVTGGLFSTKLGEANPLSASLFASGSLYFEITMATPATATCSTASCASWETAMSQRQLLSTSAYAYNAETLDGVDGASFAQLSAANTFTNTQSVNTASTSAFAVLNGANNLFKTDTTNSQVIVGQSDTTGAVLVLDTKTDSGDPTGGSAVAGAMYYNSNAGKFRCYQNTGWTDCITAAGGATLQSAYDASGSPATITTTAAKGIKVAAGAAPTADIFTIDNTGQAVTTAGVSGLQVTYVGGATTGESSGIRVDYTPGATSTSTWNGMRIVANATGAASGVSENGLKLEGPSSPGSGTETAVKIGTGWDIGADLQSGGLQFAAMSDPATPAANNLRVYAKAVSGRMMLKVKAPSGVDYTLQPSLFQQQVTIATPGITATTIAALGNGIPVLTGTGAAATTTQAQGAMNRITSGTTAGTGAGVQTTTVGYYRGTGGTNADGFFYYVRVNFAETTLTNYTNTTTGMRFFAGLSSLAITGATSMVASDAPTGDYAGFQYSAVRDTGGNFQFITRDNATQSVVNTGVALAISKTYDFMVYCAPGGSTIYWRITNLTDGTTTENSTSTNLPTTTTAMRTGFAIAPLSTTARYLHWQRLYTESDR